MSVIENYRIVDEKVRKACERAGRKREEVTLIAVSKTKPVSMIEELLPLDRKSTRLNSSHTS